MTHACAHQTSDATATVLLEIASRCGTPCYAYDLRRLREQVNVLRTHLPERIEIFYSLKANASLGISEVFSECGLGADVASAGELATAVAAGFPPDRIFVAGPYKSPETLAWLQASPEAIVSIDSPSELEQLIQQRLRNRAVLRLRPDFRSGATVAAGPESRFGFLFDQLPTCRALVASSSLAVIGFHVFAGSQVLSADAVIAHLRGALDLAKRAGRVLGLELAFINLGGGFGIAYGANEPQLDLAAIGRELRSLIAEAAPARLALELGRFLVAPAGWYLTRVVGYQTNAARRAVVVDGGTHQRADLCGLCLRTMAAPPLVLDADQTSPVVNDSLIPTDVLGCLSLPADILAESCLLPQLALGNVLAFANSGAYGLWASAVNFHGYAVPAEAAFDRTRIRLLREPQPARSILDRQRQLADGDSR